MSSSAGQQLDRRLSNLPEVVGRSYFFAIESVLQNFKSLENETLYPSYWIQHGVDNLPASMALGRAIITTAVLSSLAGIAFLYYLFRYRPNLNGHNVLMSSISLSVLLYNLPASILIALTAPQQKWIHGKFACKYVLTGFFLVMILMFQNMAAITCSLTSIIVHNEIYSTTKGSLVLVFTSAGPLIWIVIYNQYVTTKTVAVQPFEAPPFRTSPKNITICTRELVTAPIQVMESLLILMSVLIPLWLIGWNLYTINRKQTQFFVTLPQQNRGIQPRPMVASTKEFGPVGVGRRKRNNRPKVVKPSRTVSVARGQGRKVKGKRVLSKRAATVTSAAKFENVNNSAFSYISSHGECSAATSLALLHTQLGSQPTVLPSRRMTATGFGAVGYAKYAKLYVILIIILTVGWLLPLITYLMVLVDIYTGKFRFSSNVSISLFCVVNMCPVLWSLLFMWLGTPVANL